MGTVTFDTFQSVKQLRDAGVPDKQAEAQVQVVRKALGEVLGNHAATKEDIFRVEKDIARLEGSIKQAETKFEGGFRHLQWMLGFGLVMISAIFWKLYK